ncbi:MAG: YncE family protein [Sandaracinaceae bacterium]
MRKLSYLGALALATGACSEAPEMMMPDPMDTLRSGAAVEVVSVYESGAYTHPRLDGERRWFPTDLDVAPNGDLWVVQQMEWNPAMDFDEESDMCPTRAFGPFEDLNDYNCLELQGSTVTIPRPAEAGAADRAQLIVDPNSLHFLRMPTSIAFGAAELTLASDSPGNTDLAGLRIGQEELVFENTFATCHEHWTANATNQGPFIGPTLWTADPSIYGNTSDAIRWGTDHRRPNGHLPNGNHLDMVHATQYCMGIAYEGDNVYWTFNGEEGTLDRYDFADPHIPGHFYHDDAIVSRIFLRDDDAPLARVRNVPSNMVIDGRELYVADSGNGRILKIDLDSSMTTVGSDFTFEALPMDLMEDLGYEVLADDASLDAVFGGGAVPSGLAVLDDETLLVGDYTSGQIALLSRATGEAVRTLDTELGEGLAGITVSDGQVFFVHREARAVYRLDVVPADG